MTTFFACVAGLAIGILVGLLWARRMYYSFLDLFAYIKEDAFKNEVDEKH